MTRPDEPEDRDHYGDGVWYDAEYVHIRHDVSYYQRVAGESPGPILEMACGTGRLTIPMAKVGATVHGVDLAPAMIARANEKREALPPDLQKRVSFTVGDMRDVRLDRKFGSVVLAFNTLMHMLQDEHLEETLQTVSAHLDPGGQFHLDVHTPFPEPPKREPGQRYDPQEMIDPRTSHRYIVTENNEYDARTQINTMRFYYQQVDKFQNAVGKEMVSVLRLRVIFPRELDTWLQRTGFEVLGDWDNFERSEPFSGKGGRRVIMAKKL